MIHTIQNKSRILVASLAIAVMGISASSVMFQGNAFAASSCDKVNIVYCGLNGSSAASYISSFKSDYASNVSGHVTSPTVQKNYTDLQSVYDWAGATSSSVAGMDTTNTMIGTLYKDGHIAVNGKTVATDALVSARFSDGSGFAKVEGNVYARKTTTSFAEASAQVLVYMPNNQAAFAVMTECGNAVKVTPVKVVTPKPPVVTPTKPVTPTTPVTTVPTTPVTTPVVTTVSTTPKQLPNTGPGDIFGLFGGVSMAGASAHRIFQKRRKA
ncbi:MAG: hypothetical protein ACQR33_05250 [Candidatus Saccharibacteria bacterium]